jgi:hypothetical protein
MVDGDGPKDDQVLMLEMEMEKNQNRLKAWV